MLEGELRHSISLSEVIRTAIETETLSSEFFLRYSDEFKDDENICQMFQSLAKDEDEHCREYKDMLTNQATEISTRIPEYQFQQMRKFSPDYFCVYDANNNLTSDCAMLGVLKYEEKMMIAFNSLNEFFGGVPQIQKIVKREKEHINKLRNFMHSRHSTFMLETGGI